MAKKKIDDILGTADADEETNPEAGADVVTAAKPDVEITEPECATAGSGEEVSDDADQPEEADELDETDEASETTSAIHIDESDMIDQGDVSEESHEGDEGNELDLAIISADLADKPDVTALTYYNPKRPIIIYRTDSTKHPIGYSAGSIAITGPRGSDYFSASCVIPGYGRVSGYVRAADLPLSVKNIWDVSSAH